MKICYVCKTEKELSEFYKNSKIKDGHCNECKDCNREYIKAWRQRPENKTKELARSRSVERRTYRAEKENTSRGRGMALIDGARSRAKQRGYDFDLELADIEPVLAKGVCEATGIPFRLNRSAAVRVRGMQPFSPSIDRIDPAKGYVKGNVRVVVWAYNAARGDWGDDVLMILATALVTKR